MEFLLEIMTEELPSSHVRGALVQLEERFSQEMNAAGLKPGSLKMLGTCRRLVLLADLGASQPDQEEIVTGPPRSAGLAPDGSFTKAASGFARSHGLDVDNLQLIKTARGEYLGFKRLKKGKSTPEILIEKLPAIIASLSFPKTMRWADKSFRFSRPVKSLLCLFNGEVVPVSFEGLVASNKTSGHFIHSPEVITVNNYQEYYQDLKNNFVLVDPAERKSRILDQFEEKLAGLKAEIYPDERLLERLLWNIECPLVIMGSFPDSYLTLPLEVLSTAMREGQELFSVVKGKKQLPCFLGIADAPSDPKNYIVTGNERVLKARLEDARFFWENDLRIGLPERVKQLSGVVFQEKLGSYADKVLRLQELVAYISERLGFRNLKKDLIEAARLSKADLLTEMVREFPGLQGKVGGLYAQRQGWPETVNRAIYEHYLPESWEDQLPDSTAGAILSIADKLDTMVGISGTGCTISGSSDPYGLRRSALGVARIILNKKFHLSIRRLIDKSVALLAKKLTLPEEQVKIACLGLMEGRLRFIFEKNGYSYDLINAALAPGLDYLDYVEARIKALSSLKSSKNFERFILMVKRVKNILKDTPKAKLDPARLVDKEEKELYSALKIIKKNAEKMMAEGDFAGAQKIIFRLQPPLNNFFDRVLVMAENKKIRNNRLALLAQVQSLIDQLADYSQIVLSSENS
ncbi:MAG: glycine--tRNA ligase subunit beta [Acidobacteriota bacterium]|nr:glycine--tRNA ligase subunit beta [Acidobacteriota bacterium]